MIEPSKGTPLNEIVDELDQLQARTENLLGKIVGVADMQWKLLPAEYLRISRNSLRRAMAALADANDALLMLPYLLPPEKPEPPTATIQRE